MSKLSFQGLPYFNSLLIPFTLAHWFELSASSQFQLLPLTLSFTWPRLKTTLASQGFALRAVKDVRIPAWFPGPRVQQFSLLSSEVPQSLSSNHTSVNSPIIRTSAYSKHDFFMASARKLANREKRRKEGRGKIEALWSFWFGHSQSGDLCGSTTIIPQSRRM